MISYTTIVRATEPRRLPTGLVAYARLEHRRDLPDWWLPYARIPARRQRRRPRGVVRAIRRAASAIVALLI